MNRKALGASTTCSREVSLVGRMVTLGNVIGLGGVPDYSDSAFYGRSENRLYLSSGEKGEDVV